MIRKFEGTKDYQRQVDLTKDDTKQVETFSSRYRSNPKARPGFERLYASDVDRQFGNSKINEAGRVKQRTNIDRALEEPKQRAAKDNKDLLRLVTPLGGNSYESGDTINIEPTMNCAKQDHCHKQHNHKVHKNCEQNNLTNFYSKNWRRSQVQRSVSRDSRTQKRESNDHLASSFQGDIIS
jgi:hypothetical protein